MKSKKLRRQTRVRSKIRGTDKRPRLSVFRSNRFIYAQLINDEKGVTLVSISEKELGKADVPGKKSKAKELGKLLAVKALKKKINEVVFDRGGYAYHGRIESVAQGAREGGLKI